LPLPKRQRLTAKAPPEPGKGSGEHALTPDSGLLNPESPFLNAHSPTQGGLHAVPGEGSAPSEQTDGHDRIGVHALTLRIQELYPAGTYRGSNWILAEREISKLLDAGEDPDHLVAVTRQFSAQQSAKGSIGTQYVLSPEKFFGPDGHWRGPFPIPKSQAEASRDSNRDELLRRTRTGTRS
jgi:hypothetical protein